MKNQQTSPEQVEALAARAPRPFATPHSAPVSWLRNEAPNAPAASPHDDPSPDRDALIETVLGDPALIAELIARACPDDARKDGWTPFARRLFLQVLAETGRVSTACDWTGLTRQSAYALRARDCLFAAGWDAACELARAPLADALYEKAMDGVTETITRDGEVVATRHRFDSRLSVAVLSRLDKRCDRAEERGSAHLALVRRWDEWLGHIGRGEDQTAAALLEPANHCQPCQLPESANPTEADVEDEELDLSDRCWKDEDGVWMTRFPPPPGFAGYQKGEWTEYGYERECTPEEAELLEADEAAALAADRAGEEQLRDSWFALIREDLEPTAESAAD